VEERQQAPVERSNDWRIIDAAGATANAAGAGTADATATAGAKVRVSTASSGCFTSPVTRSNNDFVAPAHCCGDVVVEGFILPPVQG